MVLRQAETPEFDELLECPECGDKADVHTGYGLIGGGIGPYTMCSHCGMLISKSQDDSCESHEEPELFTEIKNAEGDQAGRAVKPNDEREH